MTYQISKAHFFLLLLLYYAPLYSQCYEEKDSSSLIYTGLHFSSDKNGYVTGSHQDSNGFRGFIKRSTNGGNTWQTVYFNMGTTLEILNDVYFLENAADKGWAVGSQGGILHTLDSGATWISQPPILPNAYHAVHFPSQQYGYVAGSNAIVGTQNYGANWDTLLFIPPPPPLTLDPPQLTLRQIHFINDSVGAVSGAYTVAAGAVPPDAMILYTYDWGENWSIAYSKPNDIVLDMQFLTAPIAYANMTHELLKSTDNGENWSIVPSADSLTFAGPIYFLDEWKGYALIYENNVQPPNLQLARTLDGGLHWEEVCTLGSPGWFANDMYVNKLTEAIASFVGNGVKGSVIKTAAVPLAISATEIRQVTIFPNPTSHQVTVELATTSHPIRWELHDFTGQLLLFGENNNTFEVDLAHYPPNIYYFITSEGKSFKILKIN